MEVSARAEGRILSQRQGSSYCQRWHWQGSWWCGRWQHWPMKQGERRRREGKKNREGEREIWKRGQEETSRRPSFQRRTHCRWPKDGHRWWLQGRESRQTLEEGSSHAPPSWEFDLLEPLMRDGLGQVELVFWKKSTNLSLAQSPKKF